MSHFTLPYKTDVKKLPINSALYSHKSVDVTNISKWITEIIY